MADMYTWLPRLSYGQSGKEVLINELFDATSPSALFGRNANTSAGLKFGLYGGRLNGSLLSNILLTLPNNSTTYISVHVGDGAFSLEPDGFKEGEIPLYKVITDGGLVTNYEDHRSIYGVGVLEAPMDLKRYVRRNGQWVEEVQGIPEAPTDGKQYARKDAGWAELAASGAGDMEAATYDPQLTLKMTHRH